MRAESRTTTATPEARGSASAASYRASPAIAVPRVSTRWAGASPTSLPRSRRGTVLASSATTGQSCTSEECAAAWSVTPFSIDTSQSSFVVEPSPPASEV